MTVIAFRGGIMAADNIVWDKDGHQVGTCAKIVRLADGSLLACCGDAAATMQVRRYFGDMATTPHGRSPEKPTLTPNSVSVILVRPNGAVLRMEADLIDQWTVAPFFALGCHRAFMLGALHAGASAENAVRLAMLHTDAGCAGEPRVQVERLNL